MRAAGAVMKRTLVFLFGAELDAEKSVHKELGEGVPQKETLNLPTKAR